MISKVITGRSFSGACRYICADQKRAVVLEVEGVRGHDHKLMASDFESQHSLRPSLGKPVFHGIISFYPGEKISDTTMVEIAKVYLEKMGISDTQYAITKHQDKNHPHLHIIANLVNNKGNTIKDSWIGLKGKKVAQELTLKYGLKEAQGKNLNLTHIEQMNERESGRYIIFQAISEKLALCRNLDDLKRELEKKDIETLYKYKGQTEEIQGISFRIGNFKYKGSEVDRQFSVKNLERVVGQQKVRETTHQQSANSLRSSIRAEAEKHQDHHEKALDLLLRPERNHDHLPKDWLLPKKRKKSKGLHL